MTLPFQQSPLLRASAQPALFFFFNAPPTPEFSPLPLPAPLPTFPLASAGDAPFPARPATLLADPPHAFGPIAPLLADADLTMVNFESAVTDRGTPQPKQFHFRAATSSFEAIKSAGIDVVTFANNHVLDYGQVGLADTLAAVQAARFPYAGIGTNADAAWRPWLTTVTGRRIAIIGISQVDELASTWVATASRPGA